MEPDRTTTLFDATRDLIIVEARVWRSLESVPVSLAIDTSSSETVDHGGVHVGDRIAIEERDVDVARRVALRRDLPRRSPQPPHLAALASLGAALAAAARAVRAARPAVDRGPFPGDTVEITTARILVDEG